MSETSEKEVDTQSGEPITDYRWKRRDGVLQHVELSVLYHRKRERFFELADRCAKGIAVVFSSAAVVKAAGDGWWFQTAMAFVAVTSAISLVGSFSERARKHADLANQFGVLGAQLTEHGELLRDDQPLDVCEAKIRLLEATEPAALGVLVVICQNELARARNALDSIVHIPLLKRAFAHVINFSTDRLTKSAHPDSARS